MPPKVRITRDGILDAAVEIVRQNGAHALNARTIAAALNCSTQPIFSNFETMEDLKAAVTERADEISQEYIRREVDSGEFPAYKASGMAYIRFAKEEKELFKLLYMCDRSGEPVSEESDLFSQMMSMVNQNTGLDGMDARLFHLEIWVYVHGIASMFATGYLDLKWDLVSKMVTDMYQGMRKQFGMEG